MGSSQAAGHQHHQHGLAVRQTQQDLLITDWALCNPSYLTANSMCVFVFSTLLVGSQKEHPASKN